MIHPTTRLKSPRGFLRQALACGLLGLSAFSPFASSMAHAQYADWTANPPKILPNERVGAGAVWNAGSGRQAPNRGAVAALRHDGSVVAWGDSNSGGSSSVFNPSTGAQTSVAGSLLNVVAIYSSRFAFAAMKEDGSVVTWGNSTSGGDSSSVAGALSSDVTAVYSNALAFAALKGDGSVVTWGDSSAGGNSSVYNPINNSYTSLADGLTTNVVAVYSNQLAFAALKSNGLVVTWGNSSSGGNSSLYDLSTGSQTSVAGNLSNVVAVYPGNRTFAALKSDGSVVTWGLSGFGSDSSSVVADLSSNVIGVYSTDQAFAALKSDGSVVTWGESTRGGDSSSVAENLQSNVRVVCSNSSAFAALKDDGSVVTWGDAASGGDSSSVAGDLDSNVSAIYSNALAFAALKDDGSVVTWGRPQFGGNASIHTRIEEENQLTGEYQTTDSYVSVAADLASNVNAIYSNRGAFVALKNDGSVVTWGDSIRGGASDSVVESLRSKVAAIYATETAFIALKSDGAMVAWGEAAYGGAAPAGDDIRSIQSVAYYPVGALVAATNTAITSNSAMVSGEVVREGLATVTARGFVYALASITDPKIGDVGVTQVADSGSGMGVFSTIFNGLTPNTAYILKAYAIDEDGVTYSPAVSFSTNLPPVLLSEGGASSASLTIAENSSAVSTVSATDDDPGQIITYSIGGGADAARFAIDSSSGVLTFVEAPDFEAPTDADTDNKYTVIVRVTDNGNPPKSATQTLTITVTNLLDNGALAVEHPAETSLANGSTVNFGNQTIGQSSELTFTLVSEGETDLFLQGGAAITGAGADDYNLLGSLPPVLLKGGKTSFTVRFSPKTSGVRSASLSIHTNDTRVGRSPFIIHLSGSGSATAITATYSTPGSQVRGGWINGSDFTLGAVTTNWPSGESPDKAVDNNTGTKFLAFRNNNAGLILSPTNATLAFNRLSLYTANDASERDPASYVIYGSSTVLTGTSGTNLPLTGLTELASGTITLPDNRSTGPTVVQFANTTAYASYIVAFPTVRSTSGNSTTQISEVQLSQGMNPPYAVAMTGARGGQLSSGTFTFGSIGNSNPGTNWNANESPDQAVDGSLATKYLLFRNTGAGLIASPQAGPSRVNRLSFWTANDSVERDPLSYQVYGFATAVTARSGTLNVTASGTLLGSGTLTLPSTRSFGPETVSFANSTAYASYLVVFPTVKNSPSTTITQIAEVQFGYNGVPDFTLPTGVTTPVGEIWTARESERQWTSICSSVDGTKLAALDQGGKIYISSDSGVNWTSRESDRLWTSIASSADGMKLAAVAWNDRIYTSTDFGVTWTPRESTRYWFSIASSADGTKLAAVEQWGRIYTSSDSGATWTPRESNRQWYSICSSADGVKLAAVTASGGQIYTSTDSGASWTPRESDRPWFSIASSADGTKLAAVTYNNGAVFTSSDSGVTWTARASFRLLRSITSSADGTRLAAVTDEYSAADHGRIYTSTDSGVTWVTHESSLKWYSIASSADGNKLAAVAWNDRIYTTSASTASYKLPVAEDSGTYTESAFATGITPGLGDVGQTVSLAATNDNNALFSAQPVIAANGTLTFTPAANAYGTATVTVIATDSTGVTSVPQSFVIEVTSVIDAPVLAAPTFSDVSAYSATMQGEILNAADAEYSGKAIMYAPTSANSTLEYYGAGAVTIPLSDTPFSATRLNLLASDTQYSVRTCAYGPAGMIYSEVATFTTLAGAPVIWDNTEGLSKSMVSEAGGISGASFSTSQAVGYRIKTGDQAVQLSTVTLGLNSSSSQTCALRLRLFEAGTDSLPFGEPLLVHQDAARNFGYAGVYATIPLSGWQLSANHSYVLMIDATEGSAVWRSFINYSAFNSPTGWTSNVVVFENYAGLNAYGAGAYPLAIQVTGTTVEAPTYTHQELWRFSNFGSYDSANSAADDSDPDGDGMSNLLEYALGLDPNASGVTPASLALNGANLEYTYTRSTAAKENGISYQIEWSDTLEVGSWSTETVTQEIQSTHGALETVKASVPAGSGGKRFLRLRVVK